MRNLSRSLAVLVALAYLGCSGGAKERRYTRKQAQQSLRTLEKPGLVIGEFTLARKNPIIDGDTIRVQGLDSTLRLLAIDTEEIFHHADHRRAAETDFDAYIKAMRAKSRKPPKVGTFMGVKAMQWAKKFFAGIKTVRLERDHPKQIRGYYNRYLAYVFVNKHGKWLNYNIECVRAGMAPYFTKYGYSRRFHDEFVKAQNEARAAKRGIWNPNAKGFGDYDVRLKWWNARAEFIKKFEQDAQGKDNWIILTDWDAIGRLEKHIDKEVVVLGTVGKIRIGDGRRPTKVTLSRRMFNDFPLIFFDKDVFGNSHIADYRGEFVRVRGTVNKYRNKYTGKEVLQIKVLLPGQVEGSFVPDFYKKSRGSSGAAK